MDVPKNLDDAIEKWLKARERGDSVDPQTLCRQNPEIIGELTTYVDSIRELEDVLLGSGEDGEDGVPRWIEPKLRLEIIGLHDRGGLGRVFLARDNDLNRNVAIKFPRSDISTARLSRFEWEAQVTSQLDHPGIVPVHAIGTTEGDVSYYVMRFVEGVSLEDRIAILHDTKKSFSKSRVPVRALLRDFLSVCRTVHYAHERGLLHCDLKPQNILIGKHNQVLVLDWGEAVPLDGPISAQTKLPAVESGVEHKKSAGGTLMYRCPESLSEDGFDLTRRSDVYSLGVILYRILVGRVPFRATSAFELTSMITQSKMTLPRALDSTLPKPLSAICVKAMHADPLNRYASAAEFADDVQRWLDDEPIVAKREHLLSTLGRWVRRHTTSWIFVMAILTLLVPASLWVSQIVTRNVVLEDSGEREASFRVQYMARYIASEMAGALDRSLALLEIHAERPSLKDALEQANAQATPEFVRYPALNEALDKVAESRGAVEFESLFLCGIDGTQLERRPYKENTAGKDYRHRDYFHGLGPGITSDQPIQVAHRSEVYVSDATGNFKIALSVPVWNLTLDKVIGVLGMAVELGRFQILKGSQDDFVTSLLDVRNGFSPERNNTMLLHTALANRNPRDPDGEPKWDFAIDAEKAVELKRLCDDLSQRGTIRGLSLSGSRSFDPNYEDPISKVEPRYAGKWLAAFEPVVIRGRENLGLVVIVQRRSPSHDFDETPKGTDSPAR